MRSALSQMSIRARNMLLGTTILAGMGAVVVTPALAQDASAPMETVTVTGYRASLTDSTNAKRAAVGFTDSVFAEDIGKFPDTNIAEAFNRIPGVTITREIDGEGVDIQIRGLGTSFTKVLLNGAQVAMASTGTTDSQNTNREVDLNMLPVELFTQLTVDKSARADLLEGGAAGTVNMRSMRPFDNPGMHLTYSAQASALSNDHGGVGPRGTLIFSDTSGPFGVLVGLTGQINRTYVTGFETIGWTTPKLNAAMCPAGDCGTIGGGNWTIPATVPANVTTGGLVPGQTVDAALLTSLNPGLTPEQISNALIPRLGRPMYEKGTRSRYNGVVSLEYRPSDDLHFYVDMIGGRLDNNLDRSDIDWVGRNGAMIPENLKINANGVVTSGTFANSQFFLEARPYKEKEDFLSVNPGMDWQVTDLLHVSLKANITRSHFFRDSPTILVNTPSSSTTSSTIPGNPLAPAGGGVVTYTNTGAFPTEAFNIDLNNPANFTWSGGRVNLQDEKRYTYTNGIHGDVEYGGDEMNVKAGFAYDEAYRNITGYNNDQAWQNAVCGDNPSVFVPGPNTQPPCQGLNTPTPGAGYPTYPGLGTNYSAGMSPTFTYQGSLIPQSSLASFLKPGPNGFITANYAAIEKASNYASFDYPNAPVSGGSNTGASAGTVDEKDWGMYAELNGILHLDSRNLRYNVGLRWVQTRQMIAGFVSHNDTRNTAAVLDGGKYPAYNTVATTVHTYQSFLPSMNFVYEVADDFQVRFAVSRTMTRPNPSAMLPGVSFGDPSAAQASIGNPALAPYYSNNIDLGAELYTGGEGYIGATIFRKSLSGFTSLGTTTEPFSFLANYGITYSTVSPTQQTALQARGCVSDTNCNTNVLIQEQVNAGGLLTVNGMEFDYVQPLDFLLADYGLKGFGVTANVTIVDQKASGAAPPIATGVAPFTYNLTGYYENNGASVRFSYNYTDKEYVSGSNQNGICLPSTAAAGCPTGAYLFAAPHGQLDFSSSYELSKLFGDLPSDPEITFDIQNLNKAKLSSYFQYPAATFTYYNPGSIYLVGIRGTF
ncbi:MAG: TonB-dependent receptor [Alphaproteobacteria bacterium]|nr:TonB-dependent receptor [Alphaproteobacteria bacterium]